jgi:lysozyme
MHRFTTQTGINLIKNFEGFMPVKYLCAGNYWTIGYGHKLSKNERYHKISQDLAEEILLQDLFIAERAVLQYINAPLLDNQFDALVSFTFNAGAAALQRSTLRQKVNYQLYDEAAEEFLKWVYVGTKKLRGLMLRRRAESRLFNFGSISGN